MEQKRRERLISIFRNFVFGVEDSLVSTLGLLSGMAAADQEGETIVLAGLILIFVEAFSMGVGSLLSDNTAREMETRREEPLSGSFGGGVIMFVSYFISGFVPLAPYFFLPIDMAFSVSVALSLAALFALGAVSARWSGIPVLRQGLKMAVIGGLAIFLGVFVGSALHSF